VFNGGGLDDLLEQQAAATLALAGVAPTGEIEQDNLPFALQARLLIYIDQFFK
jgi:hypothetical protein